MPKRKGKWSLFPYVDLWHYNGVDTNGKEKSLAKYNVRVVNRESGKVCGKVEANANAILNAKPNAEDNRTPKGSAQRKEMFRLEPLYLNDEII